MKLRNIANAWMTRTVVFTTALALLFPLWAGAKQPPHQDIVSADNDHECATTPPEASFQGTGIVDSVMSLPPQPTQGEGEEESQIMIVIDGTDHRFAPGINILCHYRDRRVTVDSVKPGDLVGFSNDPSGLIHEMWILQPDPERSKNFDKREALFKSLVVPKETAPKGKPSSGTGSGKKIKNEDGVWKN